ncbi:uncharacterized protein LOC135462634 [Liolophura sinensis]|uniref:uncharacterized protein LOC135462634 n=1 Tax=Liolophura sinensis TaxID=3198878 RepID=UPI0031597982
MPFLDKFPLHLCVSVVCVLCFADHIDAENPRVNTTSGAVEGFVKTVKLEGNRTVDLNVFLGIPYAEPPVGKLRLRRTVTKVPIPGVFNATNFGPICPQPSGWPNNFAMKEDCLVLNIYAPSNASDDDPRSTMVWIHGGSYITGTGNLYDGTLMSALGDVVVVTINYRLGVLGYFSTEDTHSPGNYGAYDQQMALLWVINNIQNFGGNRSNITVMGESAGASSVSLLTLNSPTNVLFKRVIVESGTALANWAMVKNPKEKAKIYAAYAQCPQESQPLVDCVRNMSVADIIKYQAQMDAMRATYGGLSFGPVVDHQFFLYSPEEIAKGKTTPEYLDKFRQIDHLVGTNSQEGAWIYDLRMAPYRQKLHINDSVIGLPKNVFIDMVNRSAYDLLPAHAQQLLPALEYKYTDFRHPDDGMGRAIKFIDALTDSVFYSGIVPLAQLHARLVNASSSPVDGGSTYFYLFDHRGSWRTHEPWRTGADHGDEVWFVFGYPMTLPTSPPEEKALSLATIRFWTNFAKTGNPNTPEDPMYSTGWPKYEIGVEKYIRLSADIESGPLNGSKLAADRVAFWTDFLPKFSASFPTATPCPSAPKCTGAATTVVVSEVLVLLLISLTLIPLFRRERLLSAILSDSARFPLLAQQSGESADYQNVSETKTAEQNKMSGSLTSPNFEKAAQRLELEELDKVVAAFTATNQNSQSLDLCRTTMLFIIITLGLLPHSAAVSVPVGSVLATPSGKYRGLPPDEVGVIRYLGIAFAEPPIGKLRFKPTKLISPHSEVYDATSQTAVCPQTFLELSEKYDHFRQNFTQNEDCLFLDVYVPPLASVDNPKAVLVWIHGGGYIIGYKNTYNAALLAGLNDVIVVTINYRLGVLGFLTTGDEHAPGNLGLRDQIVALQWIQKNIASFGGDKHRVTIAGESAGGGSVSQLLVTPASKGLFHRVIAQSGTAIAPWSRVVSPLTHVHEMASSLGCPVNDSVNLLECLRHFTPNDFLAFQNIDLKSIGPKWGPIYDNDFFPFTLEELKNNVDSGEIQEQLVHTDLMIGVCSEEGALFYSGIEKLLEQKYGIPLGQGLSSEHFNSFLSLYVSFLFAEKPGSVESTKTMISYLYKDWQNPDDALSRSKMLIQFLTDALFCVPAVEFARLHAGMNLDESRNGTGSQSPRGRTFFYQFNHPVSWLETSPWRTGADHGDDVFFVYGFPLTDMCNATDSEKVFTRQMMKYWTNFVKTGDPNQPSADVTLPKWPHFETGSELYLELDTNLSEDSVKGRITPERVAFWTDLLPKHDKEMKDLYASLENCTDNSDNTKNQITS